MSPSAEGSVATPPRCVLFDVDDTLVTTTSAMYAAGAAAIEALWPQIVDGARAAGARRYRADPGGYFRAYTRGELTFADMRRRRIDDLASTLGVLGGVDHESFIAAYDPALSAALRAFDDVVPTLRRLRADGVAVGALTNSAADYTSVKLRVSGLTDELPVVVTPDELGVGKPDPRVYHRACALLGVEPHDTAYVGDELDVDPVGAQDAGLRGVWLRREGYSVSDADLAVARARAIPLAAELSAVLDVLGLG